MARLLFNINSKGEDISEGAAAIWMGRRPWRGGGYRDLVVVGRAVWLLARVEFLCTFVVFLCKKTDKLLASC